MASKEEIFLSNTEENSSSLGKEVHELRNIVVMIMGAIEGLENRIIVIEQGSHCQDRKDKKEDHYFSSSSRQGFNENFNAPKPRENGPLMNTHK